MIISRRNGFGNDSHTRLLLHLNGSNGSTLFPDSSGANHSVTYHGAAQISTGLWKFGNSSLNLGSSGDNYLSVSNDATFNFTNMDFTIDFWWRTPAQFSMQECFCSNVDAVTMITNGFHFEFYKSVNKFLFFNVLDSSNSYEIVYSPVISIVENTWYHIAISKYSGKLFFFLNGILLNPNGTTLTLNTIGNPTQDLFIGQDRNLNSVYRLFGNMNEFRISSGIARWVNSFTVPGRQY